MESVHVTGDVALVTGASAGIGKATALALAGAGARVALVARRAEQLQEVVDEIRRSGGESSYYVADVALEDQAAAAVARVEETFGAVDILVNNAGIIRPGSIASGNPRDWRDTFDINLLAPMYVSRGVLPGMQSRGKGHIVTVSSNAAKLPGSASNAAYSASKYALTALVNALRNEVASYGIRVTVVEPGATESDIASTIPDEATRAQMDAYVHREGVMKPEDVAAAILYAVTQPQRVNVNEIWLTPTQ
jgi:NADP-dependent 3-hydroxy acid dehydrogenase YdfG